MNSAKVIKLASHCVQTFYWMQRMETYLCSGGWRRRWRRGGWLFPFSSVASSSSVFGVVFLVSVLSPPLAFLSVSFFFLWDCVREESFWSVLSNSPALDKYYDCEGPGVGGWLDSSFLGFCFFPVLFVYIFFLLISGSSFSAGTQTIARLILVSVLLLPFLSFSLWICALFFLSLLCFSSVFWVFLLSFCSIPLPLFFFFFLRVWPFSSFYRARECHAVTSK